MQQQNQSTLDVIYKNWQGYHAKLRDCIAPLTHEHLVLQPAAHMWPLGQIVQHIISVRAGWFSGTLQDDNPVMNAYMSSWGQRESPARSAIDIIGKISYEGKYIYAFRFRTHLLTEVMETARDYQYPIFNSYACIPKNILHDTTSLYASKNMLNDDS